VSRDFPAWMKRHGSPGDARVDQGGDGAALVLTNRAVYSGAAGDVSRRANIALNNRVYALTFQTDRFLSIAARQAGL
jgi:hypothetical protein